MTTRKGQASGRTTRSGNTGGHGGPRTPGLPTHTTTRGSTWARSRVRGEAHAGCGGRTLRRHGEGGQDTRGAPDCLPSRRTARRGRSRQRWGRPWRTTGSTAREPSRPQRCAGHRHDGRALDPSRGRRVARRYRGGRRTLWRGGVDERTRRGHSWHQDWRQASSLELGRQPEADAFPGTSARRGGYKGPSTAARAAV